MNERRMLHWPLIIGLGLFGLMRPLTRIVMGQAGLEAHAALVVGLTIVISAVWIVIVGFSRVRSPLLTLMLAGIAYAVFAILLSGILSPLLDGQLQGPLANPIAIAPIVVLNAAWGLACGAIAMLVQRARPVARTNETGGVVENPNR